MTTTKAVTIRGRAMWRRDDDGRHIRYTVRHDGETEPSAWALWTDRAMDATDERASVAGPNSAYR